MSEQVGTVIWINGPVVRARGSRRVGMLELVEVGDQHLVGEIIGLEGDVITAQVYEETSGMRPGAPIFGTGLPLSVELGPGLLTSIFDGVQRPLPVIEQRTGSFLGRGVRLTPPLFWMLSAIIADISWADGGLSPSILSAILPNWSLDKISSLILGVCMFSLTAQGRRSPYQSYFERINLIYEST